jgi:hypothetical protein
MPSGIGRLLIVFGILLVVMGAAIVLLGGLPRLPGDIYVQKKGFTLYIPILGSIMVSLILTLLLNLFFARR